ncbi:unnamed protein product, partial [Bubo scandiacus]
DQKPPTAGLQLLLCGERQLSLLSDPAGAPLFTQKPHQAQPWTACPTVSPPPGSPCHRLQHRTVPPRCSVAP